MPGYTHLQHAQLISFGPSSHGLLHMFLGVSALSQLIRTYLPGAAAFRCNFSNQSSLIEWFTGFPTTLYQFLGRRSDCDLILEFLINANIWWCIRSQVSEEIINWCSFEYQHISLSDSFQLAGLSCPELANPDMAELIRGKTGRFTGTCLTIRIVMKSLPLAW